MAINKKKIFTVDNDKKLNETEAILEKKCLKN